MAGRERLTLTERILSLFTRVQPGEGRCVGILALQAFTLMLAYYLIRPVREALILTEGTAELRSNAVGVQALLLILLLPVYGQLVRRVATNRVFQVVIGFFALNLVAFHVIGSLGFRFSFAFFVWASIFAVMAVTQFWAFATDLLDVGSGTRLFGVVAVGVSAGALAGANLASVGFAAFGPYGLMLAAARGESRRLPVRRSPAMRRPPAEPRNAGSVASPSSAAADTSSASRCWSCSSTGSPRRATTCCRTG
jgi:AAA family ATP:ADP antiporter